MASRKDPWLVVHNDPWLVVSEVDRHKNSAILPNEDPILLSFSESDAGSRTSSCCGEDTKAENKDSIIFSPEVVSPVNLRQNFVIQPHSSARNSQNLLGDMLCGGKRRLFYDADTKSKAISGIEPTASAEKMQLLKTEDCLAMFLTKQFDEATECRTRSSLSSVDVLKSCVQQIKAVNRQTDQKNVINTIQVLKTLLGVSSSVLLVLWLSARNREDIRRWFRSSPEVPLFGLAFTLDAIERVPNQLFELAI